MAGRRPKPTKLKVLEGNPGKRRLNEMEPTPETEIPTRPGWLAPEGKREWTRITRDLQRLGLLTVVDRAALATYCQWWAVFVAAQAVLSDPMRWTFTTANGYTQQVPEVGIAKLASSMMKSYLIEFGLTPASRSRLRVEMPKEQVDPFAEYLAMTGQRKSGNE